MPPYFFHLFQYDLLLKAGTSLEEIQKKYAVRAEVRSTHTSHNSFSWDCKLPYLVESQLILTELGMIFEHKLFEKNVRQKLILTHTRLIVLQDENGRSKIIPKELREKLTQ